MDAAVEADHEVVVFLLVFLQVALELAAVALGQAGGPAGVARQLLEVERVAAEGPGRGLRAVARAGGRAVEAGGAGVVLVS